ncbi:hypothetical protein [Papillibacter cinnamivorans]|uniref:Phage-related minor tail protein n=1 Tax=Papillibacter cinnamivorans DSM 12816 TaxID=1122930 RepID=A0A1W1YT74_9FIRM|nr:hypothetical protein [Papillibacter cinnamivorans]SMC39420.1 Phage-related minor tail protein [Papillibacter cinnamivorans DSM 12816]
MSSVIRSLMIKIGADLTDAQKGLKQMSKDLKSAGKEMTAAGTALTKGLTVPIVGAVAGLTGLAVKASETADELIAMSNQLGISTSSLQKLQYASRFVDVSVEDMAKGMAKTTKAMGAAVSAGDDYIEIADGLKVSIKNSNGSLKDSEQMFYDAVDALGGMTDETQREIAAQELFGKSYQDIMPLINAGSGALEAYGEEAEKVGAVLDDQTVSSLGSFNDIIEKLKAIVESAGAKIGAAFVPVLEKLAPMIEEKIVPAIEKFADWLSGLSDEQMMAALKIAGFVAALGPALSILGSVTSTVGKLNGSLSTAVGAFAKAGGGVGGVKAALAAFMGPAGIALLAIIAIAAAAYLIYKNWDKIGPFFKNLWDTVTGIFKAAWDGLTSTLSNLWSWVQDFFSKWGPTILAIVAPFIGIPLLIFQNWESIQDFFAGLWKNVLGVFKDAVNGIIKIVNLIPGVNIPLIGTEANVETPKTQSTKSSGKIYGSGGGHMAEYALGTDYVPMTGIAKIDRGETIIPADKSNAGYSANGKGVVINITGNTISSDYDVDRIASQLVKKLKLAGVIA